MLWLYILMAAVSSVVVWKGSDLLETSARKLSLYYKLPPAVHGAVVLAIGSSFPELSSAVLATLIHGEFELGLSTIIGSAIFNILVIPGIAALVARRRLQSDKLMVYKDAQFYMVSVAVLLIAFSLAVIYNPVESEDIVGELTPWMAAIPIALYFLYVFIQQQEVSDEKPKEDKNQVKAWRAWLLLLLSLALVVVSVEGLVRSAIFFGDEFDIPSFFWGITMISIVTSLPDAFVSVRLAKKSEDVASLSNILGSNIFDLLVAIPIGVIIAGGAEINFSIAIPLMGMLTLATIILFTALRTSLELSRKEAVVLLTTYALIILWVISENFNWIDLLPAI